jgi:hypothetical protein
MNFQIQDRHGALITEAPTKEAVIASAQEFYDSRSDEIDYCEDVILVTVNDNGDEIEQEEIEIEGNIDCASDYAMHSIWNKTQLGLK